MKIKRFTESLNKEYNGIIYFYDYDKSKVDRLYKFIHYWIYIYDDSESYINNIKINSIDGVRNDTMIVSSLIENNNIEVPVTDTYFIFKDNLPHEFKNIPVYGACYSTDKSTEVVNTIFLNSIYGRHLNSYDNVSGFDVIDVKKVLINTNGTHDIITSDEQIEIYLKSNKYNL